METPTSSDSNTRLPSLDEQTRREAERHDFSRFPPKTLCRVLTNLMEDRRVAASHVSSRTQAIGTDRTLSFSPSAETLVTPTPSRQPRVTSIVTPHVVMRGPGLGRGTGSAFFLPYRPVSTDESEHYGFRWSRLSDHENGASMLQLCSQAGESHLPPGTCYYTHADTAVTEDHQSDLSSLLYPGQAFLIQPFALEESGDMGIEAVIGDRALQGIWASISEIEALRSSDGHRIDEPTREVVRKVDEYLERVPTSGCPIPNRGWEGRVATLRQVTESV